jgi:putative DNA methylase
VDDPSSHPDKFPTNEAVETERKRLFAIIEELVKWENSTNEEVLEKARAEIRQSCDGELPSVYDPFSGGGSIPLEAQRLGLPAYGSDLNPVAVTIGKAMIEIPSKFKNMEPIHSGFKERNHYRNAEGLAEDVKYYGEWIRDKARERIGHLYPQIEMPSEYGEAKATVIAWIWARTVPSPDPAFSDAPVPLASSFLLNSKKGKETWLEPIIDKLAKKISYKVHYGGTVEEIAKAKMGVKAGPSKFVCMYSGTVISGDYINEQAKNGLMGETLIAIVASGKQGKIYISDNNYEQIEALKEAELEFEKIDFSDIELKTFGTGGGTIFRGRRYKFNTFKDYFTSRQLVSLHTFCQLLDEVRTKIIHDAGLAGFASESSHLHEGGAGTHAYGDAVSVYLAFAIDRLADSGSSIATWASDGFIRSTFARQAIQMSWDFAECNSLSDSTGNFMGAVDWVWKALNSIQPTNQGQIIQKDAQTVELPKNAVVSTDPPYYDNIPYADLSDFFYIWLRRNLKEVYPFLSNTLAVPKAEELIASPSRLGGKKEAEMHFLEGMSQAISRLALYSSAEFPTTIYYAFKQSEIAKEGISSTGWATFLNAVISSGYSVVGTWPIRTERPSRIVATGTNALANSVVLVCRQRETSAELITRTDFIRLLKRELPPAIIELQSANIAPADMPQSAIGPGIGIFSRYENVLEASDQPMTVKTALQLINAELDEFLNNLHGDFDPDTRFAATWFEQNGYAKGDFGVANSLATARGIAVESVKHAGIVESSAGKVRILKREELDPDWDPNSDSYLTIWECCQYLVREYEDGGETAAAMLIKKMGYEKAESVKDLAYYLYDICSNKRQDAKEATSYNALIAGWNDIMRMANSIKDTDTTSQASLF